MVVKAKTARLIGLYLYNFHIINEQNNSKERLNRSLPHFFDFDDHTQRKPYAFTKPYMYGARKGEIIRNLDLIIRNEFYNT